MAATITIQYLPGCPHRDLARDRVDAALRSLGGPGPSVEVQEVADDAEAARIGFHGSPTILVDGIDHFAGTSTPVGFACRLYPTGDRAEGAPTVEQILEAIRRP